jgi:membrane protein YqaA with SNARE-associated domain
MCYNSEGKMEERDRLKKKIFPLLALLLVVAITVGIFFFYKSYPDRIDQLKGYGYLGVFLISLTFNATLILPAGNILVLSVLGAILPSAVLVGLAGGLGAAIGEITGYMAGYSGRGLAQRSRLYHRVEGWMRRWGIMAIFIMSALPFVFDLAGIAAGVLRFPFWKFFLTCWLGRTLLYVGAALAGAWGLEAISRGMPPAAITLLAALATGVFFAIVLAIESWAWKRGW